MKYFLTSLLSLLTFTCFSQGDIPVITSLNPADAPPGKVTRYWLHLTENGLSQPVLVPVLIARGNEPGPVLGLIAAIHGNELNGIPVIQQVFQKVDPAMLKGILVGIPGLNVPGIELNQREFPDGEDLNRLFPGKSNGNESQRYTYRIYEKIVKQLEVVIDLHTASFGRENTFYVRADVDDPLLARLTYLQYPDIIVANKGKPSAGSSGDGGRTFRAEAMANSIPCLTIEYGNPQVYQPEMIDRGVAGINNALIELKMIEAPYYLSENETTVCNRSYWLYTDKGGLLEIPVTLNQRVKRGDLLGVLRNPFGDEIARYTAPEDGIIIGRSTNPVNKSGGRIVHLGVE